MSNEKEILLTINLEGSSRKHLDENKSHVMSITIAEKKWRINAQAVEYYQSFDSRPSRSEDPVAYQKWSRWSATERVEYHLAILAASDKALSYTYEVL